jgi:hypothetical protein
MMTILINTQNSIDGDEKQQEYFKAQIVKSLKIYESHITRIELHLKHENGKKEGLKDVLCMLEARLEGKQPIAVTCQANATEIAVFGAIEKMKTAISTIIGKMQNH